MSPTGKNIDVKSWPNSLTDTIRKLMRCLERYISPFICHCSSVNVIFILKSKLFVVVIIFQSWSFTLILFRMGERETPKHLKLISHMFLLFCFSCLINNNSETWETVFPFHFWDIKTLEFVNNKFYDVIKCLSMKQNLHFTE